MALEEGGDGLQQRNYLACTTLPTVYYLFSFVYLVLFALWVRVLYANMAYASRIHYLMLVVVFLTALNMFCEGEDKTSVMRTAIFVQMFLSLDILSIVVAGVEGLAVVFYVYAARKFIPQPQEHCLVDEEVEAAAREELALCLSGEGMETILVLP
ncbi:unnamed protein product [Cuscuta campestris]|uniref:Uncharacterized protein n=1 Tax=Cuscuta campestris TaxID=132261 RepID=A0A484NK65_9ASTE|nr:unnamed protein product [Cuscuta campestris]